MTLRLCETYQVRLIYWCAIRFVFIPAPFPWHNLVVRMVHTSFMSYACRKKNRYVVQKHIKICGGRGIDCHFGGAPFYVHRDPKSSGLRALREFPNCRALDS